jgi:hypothetical protein
MSHGHGPDLLVVALAAQVGRVVQVKQTRWVRHRRRVRDRVPVGDAGRISRRDDVREIGSPVVAEAPLIAPASSKEKFCEKWIACRRGGYLRVLGVVDAPCRSGVVDGWSVANELSYSSWLIRSRCDFMFTGGNVPVPNPRL